MKVDTFRLYFGVVQSTEIYKSIYILHEHAFVYTNILMNHSKLCEIAADLHTRSSIIYGSDPGDCGSSQVVSPLQGREVHIVDAIHDKT